MNNLRKFSGVIGLLCVVRFVSTNLLSIRSLKIHNMGRVGCDAISLGTSLIDFSHISRGLSVVLKGAILMHLYCRATISPLEIDLSVITSTVTSVPFHNIHWSQYTTAISTASPSVQQSEITRSAGGCC